MIFYFAFSSLTKSRPDQRRLSNPVQTVLEVQYQSPKDEAKNQWLAGIASRFGGVPHSIDSPPAAQHVELWFESDLERVRIAGHPEQPVLPRFASVKIHSWPGFDLQRMATGGCESDQDQSRNLCGIKQN